MPANTKLTWRRNRFASPFDWPAADSQNFWRLKNKKFSVDLLDLVSPSAAVFIALSDPDRMNSVIFLKIMLRIGQLGICEGEVSMEKEEDRKIAMKVILGCENVWYLGSNTGGNTFGPDFAPFQRAERRKPTDEIKITNVPFFFYIKKILLTNFTATNTDLPPGSVPATSMNKVGIFDSMPSGRKLLITQTHRTVGEMFTGCKWFRLYNKRQVFNQFSPA